MERSRIEMNRFRKTTQSVLCFLALGLCSVDLLQAQNELTYLEGNSAEISTSGDAAERAEYESLYGSKSPLPSNDKINIPQTRPEDFITWGYLQNDNTIEGIRFQALTDITTLFVSFNDQGNLINPNTFLNRDSSLKAGGHAEAAGTRVHLLINNSGFNNSITEGVMDDPTKRANLVSQIANLIITDRTGANSPGYVQGVTLDLEPFSWDAGSAITIGNFFQELRVALDAIDPSLITSWYVDPTPSATQVSPLPNYIDSIDYIIYSQYDFGTGTTPRAISDYDSSLTYQNSYFTNYGVPPEKFIVATSTYGRTYTGTSSYGVAGSGGNSTGVGFSDGVYNTTLRPNAYTNQYRTGDETSWYTDGSNTIVYPGVGGLEFHTRQAMSFGFPSSPYAGRKLAGVAFWSIMWLAETQSYELVNPVGIQTQTRTYTHFYDIMQTALSHRGKNKVLIEGFESFNPRWEDPNQSPDEVGDTDNNSTRSWQPTPSTAGGPERSTNAAQLTLEFESSTGNKTLFRHELLAHNVNTTVVDTNATAGLVDSTTMIRAFVHSGPANSPTAYPNMRVALVVMDADRQLERSAFTSLPTAGWTQLSFDLTNPLGVTGYTTAEPAFLSGNGVIRSNGNGERDIAFVGFAIEDNSSANVTRTIYFDEVTAEHTNPGGKDYVINEFREADGTAQFVEIYGPAGALPAGFQLRTFDSATAEVLTSYNLAGTINNDANGFGYFVVGDTGVPNVDFTNNGSGIVLPTTTPGSIQLYNTVTGGVYDSLVFEAHGGLQRLIAQETLGVADEGLPWIGRVGPGTNAAGEAMTLGRIPDGADSDINGEDFSAMPPTPGSANGSAISFPYAANFSTPPSGMVATFQGVKTVNPVTTGLPANAGNALRVIDTTGGGVMNFFGDATLGSTGGYSVKGDLYLPATTANAQTVGVGFCATQGATFFSDIPANSGYENGYWLIWENRAGVALNDGQPDHPGVFHFVQASNDQIDGKVTEVLNSATNQALQVTPGSWTTFELVINSNGSNGEQLLARVNNQVVYVGNIPKNGRTTGSVAFGFRENHSGAITADEGTWIDNLSIRTDAESIDIPKLLNPPIPLLDAWIFLGN